MEISLVKLMKYVDILDTPTGDIKLRQHTTSYIEMCTNPPLK